MLDKFLVLLERFVVAHELLAKSEAKRTSKSAEWFERHFDKDAEAEHGVLQERTVAVEDKPAPAKKPRATKAKPAPEPEPEVEEEEPAPKTRGKKQEKDVDVLRAEIKEMATHIAGGDSDECANEFDDLLEEFKVRTVSKLADKDVAEFHALAKEIVEKYYEIDED